MTTGNVVFSRRVVDLLEGGDKVEEVEVEEDAEAVVVCSGATTSGGDGVDVAALGCGLARAPLRATDVVAEEEDGEADGAGGSVGAVAGAVGVAVASPFDASGSLLAFSIIFSATCIDASVVGPLETAAVVGGDGFLLRGPLRATDAEDEEEASGGEVMAAAPAVLFHSSKRRVNSPTPSAEPPLPSSPFFFFFFIFIDLPSSPLLLVANPRTMGRS
jgi:hypothetical protein